MLHAQQAEEEADAVGVAGQGEVVELHCGSLGLVKAPVVGATGRILLLRPHL
jgi:hypothetical protein